MKYNNNSSNEKEYNKGPEREELAAVEGLDFPGCGAVEGSSPAVLVSTALQIPPWSATEMIKPQVCLEGSFSSGVFGRLFSGSSWSPPCLR